MQKFEIKFMGNRMVGTLRRREHAAIRPYSQPAPSSPKKSKYDFKTPLSTCTLSHKSLTFLFINLLRPMLLTPITSHNSVIHTVKEIVAPASVLAIAALAAVILCPSLGHSLCALSSSFVLTRLVVKIENGYTTSAISSLEKIAWKVEQKAPYCKAACLLFLCLTARHLSRIALLSGAFLGTFSALTYRFAVLDFQKRQEEERRMNERIEAELYLGTS